MSLKPEYKQIIESEEYKAILDSTLLHPDVCYLIAKPVYEYNKEMDAKIRKNKKSLLIDLQYYFYYKKLEEQEEYDSDMDYELYDDCALDNYLDSMEA